MIRRVDDDELLWLGAAGVELAHLLEREQLVALAVDEELCLRAARDRLEVVVRQRRRDADERRHARIVGADGQRDVGAERHAAGPLLRVRIPIAHEIERGAKVVHLAKTVAEAAGAGAGAAEVEAQHRAADAAERLRGLIDDLGVHRAAVLRMRMREDDGRAHAARMPGFEQSVGADAAAVGRLVEQRFETSRRSGEFTQRHDDDR